MHIKCRKITLQSFHQLLKDVISHLKSNVQSLSSPVIRYDDWALIDVFFAYKWFYSVRKHSLRSYNMFLSLKKELYIQKAMKGKIV